MATQSNNDEFAGFRSADEFQGFTPANIQQPQQPDYLDRALALLNATGKNVLSAGPLETAVHLGSGAVAGLGGGLGYLGGLAASNGDSDAGTAAQTAIQNALTYQPRTQQGKALAVAADKALGLIPKGLNRAGEVTSDFTGSPLAGAAVNTGGNALLQALGLRGMLRGAGGAAGAAEDAAATMPRPAPTTPAELLQRSLDNGTAVGYQVTPNYNPQATLLDRLGQSLAGKANAEQRARVPNQGVTSALAARSVGLDPAALIDPAGNLKNIRQGAIDSGYTPIRNLDGVIPVDGEYLRKQGDIKSAHGGELSGNPDVVATANFLLNPNAARTAPRGGVSTRMVPDTGDSLMPQADSGLGSLGNGSPQSAGMRPLTTGPTGRGGTIDPLTLTRRGPSFEPSEILDHIQTLRDRASDAFDAGRSDAGTAFRKQAGELEALLDRHLQDAPDLPSDMLTKYRASRQLIAKTHTVEENLNKSTGNVDAAGIARAYNDGIPLDGDLKIIADFANSAPRLTDIPQGAPLPTSPMTLGLGAVTAHSTGGLSLPAIAAARAFVSNWLVRHNENPALLQPLNKTFGQSALDAIHGNATAFGKLYGTAAPGAAISTETNSGKGLQSSP